MPVPSMNLPTPWGFQRRQRVGQGQRLDESSANPMFSDSGASESAVQSVDMSATPEKARQSVRRSGFVRFTMLPTPESWARRQRKMDAQQSSASKDAQVVLINFRMPAFMFVRYVQE
jgi:hypothetical protein